jgi:polysaccharide export outer membrane protein
MVKVKEKQQRDELPEILIDRMSINPGYAMTTGGVRLRAFAVHNRIVHSIVPALWIALVGSSLVWSQTTLRTPDTDDRPGYDPPCAAEECPAAPELQDGKQNDRANPDTPADGNLPSHSGNNDEARTPEAMRKTKRPLEAAPEPFPAIAPTEFQKFTASSVGRILPIYGLSLFEHGPTTFAPLERVPVTSDYSIGPGDELLVRTWGQIDLNARLVVDRQGEVFLPKVGTLAVAGLKYQQLQDYFRGAIGRVFRNFDLTVSLGQLRSIQVFVVGQARRPGSYTVSSLCTLVNALFASGGPSGSGSLRHIQLKRDNHVVTDFDFYDLLLHGDTSKDTRLLPGDVIYIPPTGPSIAIAGSVNVSAIFELQDGMTLASAIELAGGLATTADGQKALVERIDEHNVRRVEEFPLDAAGRARSLKDGDVVRIFSVSPHFENAVTLRGNVAHPGRREWHPGMRLRDILPNQEALVTREHWRYANSVANAGERASERWLEGPRESSKSPAGQAQINREPMEGEVENAGLERTPPSTRTPSAFAAPRLSDPVARDAPEINWDYAVIQRLNPQDLTTRLVPFNLGRLVLQGDEENNLLLEPGDVITIFSQVDLAVPMEKRSKFVRLEGEFPSSGIYRTEPGETIRHLVARTGGLTANAYLYGAEFTRESVRLDQQKGLEQLIEKLDEDISRNAMAPTGVNPDEVADQHAKLEAQRQLVEKLRGVKATGRVVLDLTPTSATVADLPEIALEDGDRFVVPFRPSTVELLGAVYNKNSFLYRHEARVEDYLRRAGGPTRDADKSRMFVIRADGSVLSKQSVRGLWNGGFDSLRLMPGDTIIVPERLSRGSFLRGLRDWSQVFSQFALGAAAVRVIQ